MLKSVSIKAPSSTVRRYICLPWPNRQLPFEPFKQVGLESYLGHDIRLSLTGVIHSYGIKIPTCILNLYSLSSLPRNFLAIPRDPGITGLSRGG